MNTADTSGAHRQSQPNNPLPDLICITGGGVSIYPTALVPSEIFLGKKKAQDLLVMFTYPEKGSGGEIAVWMADPN